MPSTSSTPQFQLSELPVVVQVARSAEGVVMPRPELRPVAADNGQAMTPSTPTMAPVT